MTTSAVDYHSRMDDIELKWKIMSCYERLSDMLDDIHMHQQQMLFKYKLQQIFI
jgi:hypothetical protein